MADIMAYTTWIRLNIIQDCHHRSLEIVYFQAGQWAYVLYPGFYLCTSIVMWRNCLLKIKQLFEVFSDEKKFYFMPVIDACRIDFDLCSEIFHSNEHRRNIWHHVVGYPLITLSRFLIFINGKLDSVLSVNNIVQFIIETER